MTRTVTVSRDELKQAIVDEIVSLVSGSNFTGSGIDGQWDAAEYIVQLLEREGIWTTTS